MKRHKGPYPAPFPPLQGRMSGDDLTWLFDQASRNRVIVEIGSYMGKSSHSILAGNLLTFGSDGVVYCVEPWPTKPGNAGRVWDYSTKNVDARRIFWDSVWRFPNLNLLEIPSEKAALCVPEKVDMVFIDGGTINMDRDIETWKGRANHLLCGHDFDPKFSEVKTAVRKHFGDGYSLVGGGSTIWFREIR